MTDNEVGNRISEFRKTRGLTLEVLAEKIGSTKSYVWELENKPSIRPSAEKVYKIAVVLETTVEDLMGKSVSKGEVQDQVFFREYQGLKPNTKRQLKSIMDALKQSK